MQACVGSGKSVMIAYSAWEAMTKWPGTRIVVIVHQKELLQQNVDKLRKIWPGAPVGIWSAAMNLKQIGDITFATIGSIHKYAHMLGPIALIHCDECHLVNPKEIGLWRAFLADVRRFSNPKVRVIGWTGTPFRGNGVWLTANEEAIFTGTAARLTMKDQLELGYLAPLIPAKVETLVDASEVETVGDDYNVKQLAEVTDTPEIVERACDSIVKVGREGGRKRWLVFAVNVEHAQHVNAALIKRGVRSAIIVGDSEITTSVERNGLIGEGGKYRTGEIECLVNVGVATTGLDVPEIDFIALLRKTKSPLLYVQICGRGMRIIGGRHISESRELGKYDCLFADYTGTVADLGPVDAVTGRMPRKAKKTGPPFRICPQCSARCKIRGNPIDEETGREKCPDCGFNFPEIEYSTHGDMPTGAPMLSDQAADEMSPVRRERVTSMSYVPYSKDGKKPSVMVNYYKGVKRIASEWLHVESNGPPRDKAEFWWAQRTGMMTTPRLVGDAITVLKRLKGSSQLREPIEIEVDTSGSYPKILEVFYEPGQHSGITDALRAAASSATTGWHLTHPPGGVDPGSGQDEGGGRAGAGGGAAGEPENQVRKLRTLSKWVVPTRTA